MLVLARSPGQTVSSGKIAERTHIPARFVTQVMGYLVRAELVGAVIGRTGGYRLSVTPDEISVLSIVEALEGDARRTHCVLRGGPCQRRTPCEIHHVFACAQEAFIAELANSSLADVAEAEPGSGTSPTWSASSP